MVKKYLGVGENINPVIICSFIILSIFFSCGQKDGESSQRYIGSFDQGVNNIVVTLDLSPQYGIISMNKSNLSDSIINIEKYFFRKKRDTILLENEFGDYAGPYLIESVNLEQVAISSIPSSNTLLFGMNRIILSIEK